MNTQFHIGLHAVIVAAEDDPLVLTMSDNELPALPFGPFDPKKHRTMEEGLRQWVATGTGFNLGYVEQLYTFGDRHRHQSGKSKNGQHFISVGYLALVKKSQMKNWDWNSWYEHFPWEDQRTNKNKTTIQKIHKGLSQWVNGAKDNKKKKLREARIKLAFPNDPTMWDEERVLERYELMYEAGLVDETFHDTNKKNKSVMKTGTPLIHDHRRILATAMARLRGKLKYRPIVFELMPEVFTLTELQKTVESLSGKKIHKQNFRRIVEKNELVEPTGTTKTLTGGRPAACFKFPKAVVQERPIGLKV